LNYLCILIETQKPDIDALIRACRNEGLGAVKEIMEEAEIDVNAIAKHGSIGGSLLIGDSPLVAAAGSCNLILIKYLIGQGANVNYRTGPNNGICDGMRLLFKQPLHFVQT